MNQEESWLLKEKYADKKSEAFLSDLKRLEAGEPLAYVIGHIPFLNCQIFLDSKPLIPRLETEYWVEKFITQLNWGGRTPTIQVLDLCAGSGAIGVAVSKALPKVSVTFSELDASHLPTIQKNLKNNLIIYDKIADHKEVKISQAKHNKFELQQMADKNVSGDLNIYDKKKYEVVESDLFEKVTGKFDFILSNPPYIDPRVDRTESSVKKFEPHLALYGGVGGMELIAKIIVEAPKYLKPAGQLWLEHEPEQVQDINELAASQFSIENHNDQYGVKRYSTLTLLSV